jgi:hypothetical protein
MLTIKTKAMETPIYVNNPFTGLEIDVLPIFKFMNETFAGNQEYTDGFSTGQTAAKEVQNCIDTLAMITVLVNKEGWDQTNECLWQYVRSPIYAPHLRA